MVFCGRLGGRESRLRLGLRTLPDPNDDMTSKAAAGSSVPAQQQRIACSPASGGIC